MKTKSKAHKIKKWVKKVPKYADGTYSVADTGKSLAYTTETAPEKPIDLKRKKWGQASASDYLGDYAKVMGRTALGTVGAENLISSNYKTNFGEKAGSISDNIIQPTERGIAGVALSTLASPAVGAAFSKATSMADKTIGGQNAKKYARLPNENDIDYQNRMTSMGLSLDDIKRMSGQQQDNGVGGVASSLGSLLRPKAGSSDAPSDLPDYSSSQMRSKGGEITAEKAHEILKDGTIRGKKISDRQRRYFGWVYGGKKVNGGEVFSEDEMKEFNHLADGGGVDDGGDEAKKNKSILASPLSVPMIGSDTLSDTANQIPSAGTENYQIDPITLSQTLRPGQKPFTPEQIIQQGFKPFVSNGKVVPGQYLNSKGEAVPYKPIETIQRFQNDNLDIQRKVNENRAKKGLPPIAYPQSGSAEFKSNGGGVGAYSKVMGKNGGGEIIGAGTSTSDSIMAKVKKDSFVVPAENEGIAEALRQKYFGNAGKAANTNQGTGVPVHLSDGEHLFTPEEKAILEKKGVNIKMLAPNAEDKNKGKAGGGNVGEDVGQENSDNSQSTTADTNTPKTDSNSGKKKLSSFVNPENILAAGQIGMGIYSLLKDGKRPVDVIDTSFDASVNQAQQDASYGINKYAFNKAERSIDSNRIGATSASANLAGGNLSTAMANIRQASNESSGSLTDLASADANVRLQKQNYADQLVRERAEMKRRLFTDKMSAFMQNQQAGANLLSSGIQNYFTNSYNQQTLKAEEQANATANSDWMNSLINFQTATSKQGK